MGRDDLKFDLKNLLTINVKFLPEEIKIKRV